MAEEGTEVENLPPADGEGEKKSAGGGMLPALIIVVLVPALTFVTTKFLLLPSIKAEIQSAVAVSGGARQGASPQAVGEQGSPAEVQIYEFEDIIANLSGALHSRYVKVSFTVEGTAADFTERVEDNKAKLMDATLGVLSSLSLMDLDEEPGIKNIIRNDLLKAFELAMKEELIEQLYFTEFVIQ